jgi:hypothetical protein
MSTEPTKHQILVQQESAAIVKATPSSILELAVRQGANVETLSKLLELQERFEANEARKAFVAALAAFKENPPKLEKVKKVDFAAQSGNRVNYNYAPLDYICDTIGAALGKHGLSFTWNVDQSGEAAVKVTCILRHEQGHSESVTMASGLHSDNRMNSIQRLGATITYLERYSLLAATGLATAEQDTDAVTMLEASDFLALINESQTIEELVRNYKQAIADALNKQSPKAVSIYMQARQKREKELRAVA